MTRILLLGLLLAGCATGSPPRTKPLTLAVLPSKPPPVVLYLNESIRYEAGDVAAQPGEVVAVAWGVMVYGQWMVQPDGVKDVFPAEWLLDLMRKRFPDRSVRIVVKSVPLMAQGAKDGTPYPEQSLDEQIKEAEGSRISASLIAQRIRQQ